MKVQTDLIPPNGTAYVSRQFRTRLMECAHNPTGYPPANSEQMMGVSERRFMASRNHIHPGIHMAEQVK
ncbi:1558_t:CDS:2, partial [Acaulospora colombiana]